MSLRITGTYPPDWKVVARGVKERAGWRCIRCDHPHDRASGRVLTVHHWDGNRANCRWWNLLSLCQRCHLSVQARVTPDRPWVMLPHSAWFRPFVAGYYAWRYLGLDLSREEVEARLDELLQVERRFVLGEEATG